MEIDKLGKTPLIIDTERERERENKKRCDARC